MNDTVREVGGALGVAVIGSVAASSYASNFHGQADHLPADVRAVVTDNIGAALTVSGQLGDNGTQLAHAAREAFVTSMTSSLWVGVALATVATVIAWTRLPKHAPSHSHGHPAHGHGHHTPHSTATAATNEAALTGNRPVQGPSKVPAGWCTCARTSRDPHPRRIP